MIELHPLGFEVTIRLPYKTVEDVNDFVGIVERKSYVTWRVTKTDPGQMSAGRKNIFWVCFKPVIRENAFCKIVIFLVRFSIIALSPYFQ